jgi:hypothetical protein
VARHLQANYSGAYLITALPKKNVVHVIKKLRRDAINVFH